MKKTAPLKIFCSTRLPEFRLNIHPNEGADLGLMTTRHSVEIGEGIKAELHLLNECPRESLELNTRFWERLGKPTKAVLVYDGKVLTIEKA